MANTFKTTTWMAKETLRHFENVNNFSRYVNKEYVKEFNHRFMRPGTSISIPKPARFAVTSGATASFPDLTEDSMSVTLGQYNASWAATGAELSVSTSNEQFSDRYLRPMAIALASQINKDGLAAAVTNVANSGGTPGTVPTAISTYLDARTQAINQSMPMDDEITMCISSTAEAKIIDALKGLVQPGGDIAKQNRDGKMGRAYGMRWTMDPLVGGRTVGTQGGTPLSNGATQSGASIVTDGWSNSITNVLRAGDVLTFAGVYDVNPVTKQTTNTLKRFVVTAAANSDGSGNATITISPALVATGTTQNASTTIADNSAITVVGSSAVTGLVNVGFHRDAFCLVSLPFDEKLGFADQHTEHDPDTGIAITFSMDGDITDFKRKIRADVWYGWGVPRPEWAWRVEG